LASVPFRPPSRGFFPRESSLFFWGGGPFLLFVKSSLLTGPAIFFFQNFEGEFFPGRLFFWISDSLATGKVFFLRAPSAPPFFDFFFPSPGFSFFFFRRGRRTFPRRSGVGLPFLGPGFLLLAFPSGFPFPFFPLVGSSPSPGRPLFLFSLPLR